MWIRITTRVDPDSILIHVLTDEVIALIHETCSVKALLAFLLEADVCRQQCVDEQEASDRRKNPVSKTETVDGFVHRGGGVVQHWLRRGFRREGVGNTDARMGRS